MSKESVFPTAIDGYEQLPLVVDNVTEVIFFSTIVHLISSKEFNVLTTSSTLFMLTRPIVYLITCITLYIFSVILCFLIDY